jgi:hypothetical protein
MKISYAITVCNEFLEIQKLVPFLLKKKRIQDEIVILYDHKNGNEEIAAYLKTFNKLPNVQFWRGLDFNGHFADWKNKLTSYCDGDYIFQIDADEMPNEALIEHLPYILEENPEADIVLVPRINTVEGLTQDHIQKWGWNMNEHGWINYPDYQWRIYRNCPEVKWINKVHERLDGFKLFATLPDTGEYHLTHPKTIDKQEKQNNYYNTL